MTLVKISFKAKFFYVPFAFMSCAIMPLHSVLSIVVPNDIPLYAVSPNPCSAIDLNTLFRLCI